MQKKEKALKLGFNWRYHVAAVNLANGETNVVVDEVVLRKRRSGFVDHIVNFSFDDYKGVESDICDVLNELFDDFQVEAAALDKVVHSGSIGPWGQFRLRIEAVDLNSPLVTDLVNSLSAINRVSVAFDTPQEDE